MPNPARSRPSGARAGKWTGPDPRRTNDYGARETAAGKYVDVFHGLRGL
jgi:hypothetical protein